MSHRWVPVGWTPAKRVYDAVLLAAILIYVLAYMRFADPALDAANVAMRAFGSCGLLLLTFALAIGPLARLDRRWLPLLYNRRHLGVLTATVAAMHALAVLGWYFAFSPTPSLLALLNTDGSFAGVATLPFIPFGIAALLILGVLAATSHDFWLAFLGPPLWKSLHMLVYVAYALVVAHVAFGYLQSATNPVLAVVAVLGCALLIGLHLVAGLRERHARYAAEWLDAGPFAAIPEGRAIVLRPATGDPVAIFRHAGTLSAVSHVCAHQNGPLGEGTVLDGCITCPWHGFQYRLADGCAPPPYTERIATYRLRLEGAKVLLDPRANPPGTFVEPLRLP